MTNVCQERFFRYRRCGLVDRLDQTVVSDVDECVGERFIGTIVDGGDERARDEERHPGKRIDESSGLEMR